VSSALIADGKLYAISLIRISANFEIPLRVIRDKKTVAVPRHDNGQGSLPIPLITLV
jgi:hypothetical protein